MPERITHTPPEFTDVRRPVLTWEDGLEVAKDRKKLWEEKRIYTESAHVVIPTPLPATIFTISDVHFGSIYSDMDKFQEDITMIEDTPNAYMIFLSNLIDNGNPSQFSDSMLVNALTPHDQAKAMNDLIKRLDGKGKILGAVKSPCHEGWTWKKMGIDINELLFADTQFPTLDNGGMLEVELGDVVYNIGMFHQFGPWNSNLNKSHAPQQLQRLLLQGQADVVAVAHSHTGEVLHTYYGKGTKRTSPVYIRSGSYKGNVSGVVGGSPDMWITDRAGVDGEPGGESVMLFPHKKEMAPHLKPEVAIEFQKSLYLNYQLMSLGLVGGELDKVIASYQKRQKAKLVKDTGIEV